MPHRSRRTDPLRVFSWNVNGLRACEMKGFSTFLETSGADVVAVQEVRAREEDLPDHVRAPVGWHASFVAAERRGYSGVGLFSRAPPDRIETRLGVEAFDAEARLQIARFGRFALANVYFPNGSGKNRSNDRVPYKLAFYRALFDKLQRLRRGGLRVVVVGDANTAHGERDLARPRANAKTSGFLPEEREEFDRWIRRGWVDTFRLFEGGAGHYTWWSQRRGVREKNVGWRIDYALASPSAMAFVEGAAIHPEVTGSDHCPISVVLSPSIRARSSASGAGERDA